MIIAYIFAYSSTRQQWIKHFV